MLSKGWNNDVDKVTNNNSTVDFVKDPCSIYRDTIFHITINDLINI